MSLGFIILLMLGYLKVNYIHFDPKVIFLSLLLLFIVAIIEEIVFRGYLLNNLMESINKYVAVAIISIIFGILHSLNPNFTFIGLLNLILFGGLLGLYYVHTKNLWFQIFFHLSWNYFQGPILGFSVSGKGHEINFLIKQQLDGNSIITGGNFGFEGSLILTVLLIISIFGFQKFFGNENNRL